MIRIRRIAVLFALGSTIYWQTVSWFIGLINPLAGIDIAPLWLVGLVNFGTAGLYAIVTLIFCHRLAGRVVRQTQSRPEQ